MENVWAKQHVVYSFIKKTEAGKKYFVQQYIKPGVFVGGANLKLVDDAQGQKAINEYRLAEAGKCSKATIALVN